MVWHAHMLNPRAYFEDCMRRGLRELWHIGLPWQRVNDAIDANFNYNVSPECMVRWEQTTGRKWENADDPFTKTLPRCPECKKSNVVPWSTCNVTGDSSNTAPSIGGQGYGDGEFKTNCAHCGKILKRDYLEVFQFVNDVKRLLAQNHPMPGTILDNKTGMATRIFEHERTRFHRTFPNRLIRYELRSQLYDPPPASMNAVREIIEKTFNDADAIKRVDMVEGKNKDMAYRLAQEARIQVRKMMSRYWGNSSSFALELGGAVLRQGIFTEKMYKVCSPVKPSYRMHRLTYLLTSSSLDGLASQPRRTRDDDSSHQEVRTLYRDPGHVSDSDRRPDSGHRSRMAHSPAQSRELLPVDVLQNGQVHRPRRQDRREQAIYRVRVDE